MNDCNLISSSYSTMKAKRDFFFWYRECFLVALSHFGVWCCHWMCERIKEHQALNKRKLKRRKMSIEITVHFSFCGISFHRNKGRRVSASAFGNFLTRRRELKRSLGLRFLFVGGWEKSEKPPHFCSRKRWCFTFLFIVEGSEWMCSMFGWLMILLRKWQNKTCLT